MIRLMERAQRARKTFVRRVGLHTLWKTANMYSVHPTNDPNFVIVPKLKHVNA